jgi:hypothetical protein
MATGFTAVARASVSRPGSALTKTTLALLLQQVSAFDAIAPPGKGDVYDGHARANGFGQPERLRNPADWSDYFEPGKAQHVRHAQSYQSVIFHDQYLCRHDMPLLKP